MKRTALALVVLLLAAMPLFAHDGKSCDMKTSGKNVELTGTIADNVFHVANSSTAYDVCEKSNESALKLGSDGKTTLKVKGKIVHCGGGEKLMIESANKI